MTTQPSREVLQKTLDELIEAENEASAKTPNNEWGHTFAEAKSCCTLFWDDTTDKLDESFTVTGDKMCRDLADKHGAKRRPLLPHACR